MRQRLTAKQITAVAIADGERVAAHPVSSEKPALKIRAPYAIGAVAMTQGRAVRPHVPAPPGPGQAPFPKQFPHRAGARPVCARLMFSKPMHQLHWTPCTVLVTQFHDALKHCIAHRIGMMQRRARALRKPANSKRLETP